MNLEEQISQITNPQEFVRLCNSVLTEKHGPDFQVIDGTRSDEGNDGYIISEKRVLTIFCPIKPERKKDTDYLQKIRSDLRKAVELRESGKFKIEKWTFLTPRKLSNDVIAKMRTEANTLGIEATHQEATFLANEIHKNKHIIDGFPDLYVHKIDDNLKEILDLLKQEGTKSKLRESDINDDRIFKREASNKKEIERVLALREDPDRNKSKPELKAIFYSSGDASVRLNALLGLLDFYNPLEDSADDLVQLCDEGIHIAEQIDSKSAKAYLLGQKGYLISSIYSFLDMQTGFQIHAGNLIGFPVITESDRQKVLTRLRELEADFNTCFEQAMTIAKQNYDLKIFADILVFIGNAAGQRALYLQGLNVRDQAAIDRKMCKDALLAAKDIYVYLNDELLKTNALFNLANQIRFFGEEKEALSLTENTIEVAKRFGDEILLRKAESLKHSLVTGEIPNYMGGEKKEI